MSEKTTATSSSVRTVKEANRMFILSIIGCCIATAGLLYLVHIDILSYLAVAIIQWVAVVYFTMTQNS